MRRNGWFVVLPALLLTPFLHAGCAPDHRSNKNSGWFIADFAITGTQTLNSTELSKIKSKLTGSCVDEDSDQLEQRVRMLFQDRGYFLVEVKSLSTKPMDPLAVPKPVTVEAEVLEGPRCRLADIRFEGNRAFDTGKLRSAFPLQKGELFEKDKLSAGLEKVGKLYGSQGFLDFTAVPETQDEADATVMLLVTIDEGTQYRMGELKIFAKKELADRLMEAWRLPKGAVFDNSYLDKYVGEVSPLLPQALTRESFQVVRDCPNASVDVRLPLETTSAALAQSPKDIECERPDTSTK